MEPGDRLGRYELARRLGRGGAGEVWQAVLHGPEGFRKGVALKLLHGVEEADWRAVAREARLGALVSHPNVVATHEVGRQGGVGWLAMELVSGPTLHALVAARALPEGAAVDLGLQLCAALGHLHGLRAEGVPAGLVHRDVKPGNVLVDPYGVAKLADLGIARPVHGDRESAGTLGYAPPEQLRGEEDARADLFALGVTLVVALTRALPFGRGEEAARAVFEADAVLAGARFRESLAAIPRLAPILARCLRTRPADRYPTARALALDLGRLWDELGRAPSLTDVLAGAAAPEGSTTPTSSPPTRRRTPTNLPRPRRPFVGREAEVSAVVAALGRQRVVTLAGLGGIGKTSVAVEVGARTRERWPGGVWFVDLTPAGSVHQVLTAVAHVLATPLQGKAVHQLGLALRQRGRVLVVVDNAEHVVEALADVLQAWLEAAPEAAFLVTSRVPLRLSAEEVVALGPMVPTDAVALFRGADAAPASEEESAFVAALDGIPLAVVLAAARAKHVPVAELARHAEHRLRLLSGGDRDDPDRHRSIRAALDGTFSALPPAAALAASELSVFPDGFTPEDAERVVDLSLLPDPPWLFEVLGTLVEHGLLHRAASDGRFRMLDLVRRFARERLAGPGAELRYLHLHAERSTSSVADLEHATRRALALGHTAAFVALLGRWRRALGRVAQTDPVAAVAEEALAVLPRGPGRAIVVSELVHCRYRRAPSLAPLLAALAEAEEQAGGDPFALGRLALVRADVHRAAGQAAGAAIAAAAREAVRRFEEAHQPAWAHLAHLALALEGSDGWLETVQAAAEYGRRHGDAHVELRALAIHMSCVSEEGSVEDTRALLDRGLALAERVDDRVVASLLRMWQCVLWAREAQPTELVRRALGFAEQAALHGLPVSAAEFQWRAAAGLVELGRREEALALYRAADGPTRPARLVVGFVDLLAARDVDEAERALASAEPPPTERAACRAVLAFHRGDLEGAGAALREALPEVRRRFTREQSMLHLAGGEVWLGRPAAARALLAQLGPSPGVLVAAERAQVRALVALAEGDLAAVREQVEAVARLVPAPDQSSFRVEAFVVGAVAEALFGPPGGAARAVDRVRRDLVPRGHRAATLAALRALAVSRTDPEAARVHLTSARPASWVCRRYVEAAERVLAGRGFFPPSGSAGS